MSDSRRVVGLIPFDAERHPLGWPQPPQAADRLQRTIGQLRQCAKLDDIIIAHPDGQAAPSVEGATAHATSRDLFDDRQRAQVSARKFSPAAWRGGIGGATCYDEILCPAAMAETIDARHAHAALVVGCDWCEVDPSLCDAVIDRHLEQPDDHRMTFTQAPPGKCGMLLANTLLAELRDNRASVGLLLDYNPRLPQGDPIARDMCIQIDPQLRRQRRRFTHDAPRWRGESQLPQAVTVELTPTRPCGGPMTPQHHLTLDRSAMSLDTAQRLFAQLAAEPDVSVMLGGLGDALVHPQWADFVEAAHDAGLWGIALRTDLLVDEPTLDRLLGLPLDAVIVNLNADSPEVYAKLMGREALDEARGNLQWLLNHRDGAARRHLPWLVPAMTKTPDNVGELEAFVDRWTYFCGQALVESPSTGCGLIEDQAVIDMAPPRRLACRQLESRMTILSDGTIAGCDQDWLGRAEAGNLNDTTLVAAWAKRQDVHAHHEAGRYAGICAECREWHRP